MDIFFKFLPGFFKALILFSIMFFLMFFAIKKLFVKGFKQMTNEEILLSIVGLVFLLCFLAISFMLLL